MPQADTGPPPRAAVCVYECEYVCACQYVCNLMCIFFANVCVCVFQRCQTMGMLSDIAYSIWMNQRGIQTKNPRYQGNHEFILWAKI